MTISNFTTTEVSSKLLSINYLFTKKRLYFDISKKEVDFNFFFEMLFATTDEMYVFTRVIY